MPVQYGFGLGSNSAIQNPSTAGYGTNTGNLFIDPNGFGQSYGMNNQPMPNNFNSNILQPNNPLGGINLGSNQFESDSLEGLVGPYSSTSQGQFVPWGTGNLGQNYFGGFDSGSGAQDQAGPSNPSMSNLLLGPGGTNSVDPEDVNPDQATSSKQGPEQ